MNSSQNQHPHQTKRFGLVRMLIAIDYKIVRFTMRPNPWNILKSVET